MTAAPGQTMGTTRVSARAPWTLVLQAAAALAASMGIGRFAYTPILPLMHTQAGLSAQYGSALATANYAGYLAGALLGIVDARASPGRRWPCGRAWSWWSSPSR